MPEKRAQRVRKVLGYRHPPLVGTPVFMGPCGEGDFVDDRAAAPALRLGERVAQRAGRAAGDPFISLCQSGVFPGGGNLVDGAWTRLDDGASLRAVLAHLRRDAGFCGAGV